MGRDRIWGLLLFAALVAALCALALPAWAQETAPVIAAPGAAAAWLTSDAGRIACGAVVYALVALLKLVPLRSASPAAKIASVVALGLGAGAGAWGGGASLSSAIVTAGAAAVGAIASHELVEKVAGAALPFLARWPTVAGVVRAVLAPSAPTVAEHVEDAQVKT